jgi:hypothetical protein
LGPELVIDLITEDTLVKIGGKLQGFEGYYAPRQLERYIWLQSIVLEDSNYVSAVIGATEEDLRNIVPLGKTVERVWVDTDTDIDIDFTQNMSTKIFLLPDEDAKSTFLAIGEKLQGKTLHWVEVKNGALLWKMSRGSTNSLLDYIDANKTYKGKFIASELKISGGRKVNEESIWDLGERTVLVVAKPGMGKSGTTKHVGWHTKQRDPTSWVLRIDWNDHTKKLNDINTETFNLDSLVEFFCSAAFPESKSTGIDSSLLKQALQNSGNVTVLMDGYDEISPLYADKAAVILPELIKTKVARVWVTSRPEKKRRLERNLSVFSFRMKRLPWESQKGMLRKLWQYETGEK